MFVIFTKEQTDAIYARNGDLLVSAAAGSGKTAVLVERIIQIVTDIQKPVDIDRLLVVTFTEAAALEMRQRIYKAIAAKVKETPDSEHLNRQLILLGNASIMTLHSFCLGTIRKYFYEINIDPSFRVADVTETDLLKQEILRELFEDCYESRTVEGVGDAAIGVPLGFTRLVEFYASGIKDDALQSLVLDIYEFVQSGPNPEKWLSEQAESFNFENAEQYYNGSLYRYFVQDTETVLDAAIKSMDNALLLCQTPNIHEKYTEAIRLDREKIILAKHALEKGLPDFYYAMSFDFERLTTAKSTTPDGTMSDEEVKERKEKIKQNRDTAKNEIKKLQEKALFKPPAMLLQDIKDSYPIIRELCNVVIEFSARFSAAKRSKNIADFSDFEHLCLKVLENEAIADEIRQKYEEVLVDEYQDINLVQETILESVSRKIWGKPNRFMVGDIKQSIYRFRMANPDLFREKYNSYSRENGATERVINLSKNFRSRNAVLDSVNFLFRRLMSGELGEVTYDGDAELYFGAEYYGDDSENNKTEVCVIDTAGTGDDGDDVGADLRVRPPYDDDGGETDDLLQDLTKYEIEAKITAKRIKELTESFIVTNSDGSERMAQFSDVVILLRTQKLIADVFARELKNLDIPAFAGSSDGYFESIEIMTVLSFLQVIDNPRQDIPLISTMYSPLFSFTADELVEIRQCGKGKLFYDCVTGYVDGEGEAGGQGRPPLQAKLENFLESINKWRDRAGYTEISELIWAIYEETEYYNYAGALIGGNVRQANLRALFERAVQYEKTSLKGLFHFVKYIEKLQKSNTELGDAKVMSENENLVRIMSIHKSKGLEFPIVFVCGLGKKFNMQDAQKGFLMHQGLGFGSFHLDLERRIKSSTLNRYTIGKIIKRESLSEELRVLYVALTRAKEKLILVGSTAKLAAVTEQSGELINMTTYLEWVLFALGGAGGRTHRSAPTKGNELTQGSAHASGNELFDVYTKTRGEVEIAEAETADKYVDMLEKLKQIDVRTDYSGMKDAVYKRLSYVYPNLSATEIPSKMSVSEIKRLYYQELIRDSETLENMGADLHSRPAAFAEPQFITGVMPPDGAEIGTIFHTVMEHMDFSMPQTTDAIRNFLNGLVNENILTKEKLKYVSVDAIYKFLNSGIAERMRNAVNITREAHFTIGVAPSEIRREWAAVSGEKIIVHGVIDCFFEEGDGIVLVDYKTDRLDAGKIDEAVEKYRLQLELYKKAIEMNTGKKVIQSILYFFSQNAEKVI